MDKRMTDKVLRARMAREIEALTPLIRKARRKVDWGWMAMQAAIVACIVAGWVFLAALIGAMMVEAGL